MTLDDFQKSSGIPAEEQILLLNNPGFPGSWQPVFRTHVERLGSSLLARLTHRLLRRLGFHPDLKRPASTRWFLGHNTQSADHVKDTLFDLLQMIEEQPQRTITILMGKGDYELTPEIADRLPPNIQRLTGNNLNVQHPKLGYLPMGRDFRNQADLPDFLGPQAEKTHLCYCNFSVDTHPVRETIYRHVKGKPFIEFDHMGQFRSYSISRREFLSKLAASRFVICPRGAAIDTFRLWDCLYLGTIPIVVKEAIFHDQLADLPILFLDRVDDFEKLDEARLEKTYENFLEREFNYTKLKMSHWIDLAGGD